MGLEALLGVLAEEASGEIEVSVMAQAGEHIGDLARALRGVEDAIGGEHGELEFAGEGSLLAEASGFAAEPPALHFHVDVLRAKEAEQALELGAGIGGVLERAFLIAGEG